MLLGHGVTASTKTVRAVQRVTPTVLEYSRVKMS